VTVQSHEELNHIFSDDVAMIDAISSANEVWRRLIENGSVGSVR